MTAKPCSFRDCDKVVHCKPSRRVERPFCCNAHRRAEQAADKRDKLERIKALMARGLSPKEVAVEIGLSKGRVNTILHEQAHPAATRAARGECRLGDRTRLMERPPARIAAWLAQLPACERRFVEWEMPWLSAAKAGEPHAP